MYWSNINTYKSVNTIQLVSTKRYPLRTRNMSNSTQNIVNTQKTHLNYHRILTMVTGLILAIIFMFAVSNIAGALATSQPEELTDNTADSYLNDNLKNVQYSGYQFCQSDDRWGYLPYWQSNVSAEGCGLCSYTTVINFLKGTNFYPDSMLSMRGDWQGMDGYVDDITGTPLGQTHKDYTMSVFGIDMQRIEATEFFNSVDDASAFTICAAGNVFLDSNGNTYSYPGHFVAVCGYDGEFFHVADSALSNELGDDILYTPEQMSMLIGHSSNIVKFSAT